MLVSTFIKEKNKIVRRVTGLTLVPEDQIMETSNNIPLQPLDFLDISYLDYRVCPYCMEFVINAPIKEVCVGCPMYEAGNKCETSDSSTWGLVDPIWDERANQEDIKELYELTIKYNNTLGEE